jgi:hypothetical protein
MTKPLFALPARVGGHPSRWVAVTVAVASALCTLQVAAQAPAAPATTAAPMAAEELEQLVARIALYPDDLVGIILPASTNPLQIVQADRYLDKRKQDPKAPIDEKWDDPVKALLNYPEVVKMMSQDLDWTAALGEAVVADTGEVMEAVQSFRRRTQSAGNLKTDDKQTVVVEKEVIKIGPSNPEVIYVPQYNPTTVVYAGYSWGYYPSPYPVYYYPYAPGAAFAAGIVWGAAMGAIWNGGHYGCGWGGGGNNDITINRGGNTVNVGSGNVGSGNRGGSTSSSWKSNKQPGQVSNSVGKSSSASSRVGDARGGGAGGDRAGGAGAGGARPSTQQAGGVGGAGGDRGGAGAGARPSTQQAGGMGGAGGDRAGGAGAGGARPSTQPSGGAFGGTSSSGRQTQMDSSRGASSRASAGASSRSMPSGGGARAGGGGGGRGGGGRR